MEIDFLNDSESDFELGADDSQLSEVYLADGVTDEGENGLIWKEILREGEWAYRPGPGQKPIPVPLKVVSGKANSKTEIGMADLLEAFNEGAVDHVTVPTSHEDRPHENTGHVRALKMNTIDGKAKLLAGIEFTEPDIKSKVLRHSIANTSAGIIFDYVRKDSGKDYRQVLGHVALTNKPWINGMEAFSMSPDVDMVFSDDNTVGLVLSDGPDENYLVALGADEIESLENLHLKDFTAGRRRELASKGHALPDGSFPIENEDDLKNAISAIGRAKNKEAAKRHIIKRAKALGKTNLLPDDWKVNLSDDNEREATEVSMAETKEEGKTEETRQEETSKNPAPDAVISEETRQELFSEIADKFKSEQAEKDAENKELRKKVHAMEVDKRVGELKEEGFSEYPGLLKEIRNVMLADNGSETLTLSETVDGKEEEISLSVTGAVERIISALPKQDGKVNFGEQHSATDDKNRPDVDPEKDDKTVDEKVALAAEELGLSGFETPETKKDGDS
jgi:hypothetical protein